MWGLLVGDAVGVPYEFHPPESLPPREEISIIPPAGFPRSYPHVPLGSWSDDGAQALCLAESLQESQGWNAQDFASRLLRWRDQGYMAANGKVFDIGIQTAAALNNLAAGIPPDGSGLGGERNNGNGSLMRSLPVALFGPDDPAHLIQIAHEQSRVTHAHPRSQMCCALYVLWARAEMIREPSPVEAAIEQLRQIYKHFASHQKELDEHLLPALDTPPRGTGYVVDSLSSAIAACRETDYRRIVQRAISFGHDTDTTACLAGGIASLRYGLDSIPPEWLDLLQAQRRGR